MRQKHVLTALAIFAVIGAVNHSQSLAQMSDPLSHDAYSRMSGTKQGPMPGDQSSQTGEYKSGSPSNATGYSTKPSDPSFHKESSGSPTSPYSETIYGGVPTTPSADPAVKELNRDPSMR